MCLTVLCSVLEQWEYGSDGSAVCTKTVETCEPCHTKGTKTTGSRIYTNTPNAGEGQKNWNID